MKPLLTAAAAVALLLPLVPTPGQTDYEAIPPHPGQTESGMREANVSLVDTIKMVEESLGGIAQSASITGSGQDWAATLTVYADGAAHRVIVDAKKGTIVRDDVMPRFPGDPVDGEWTETASGLKYYDIKVGEGETPPDSSSRVTVHYSGWLVDGTQFDSSVERGQPATFPLNGVIGGWTEGVGSMRVGGKRKLIIPYDLAYGARGRGPTIPPKATLIFDVELLEIVQ
jgi:FKBP-type peptidyl-prolyl cis-trans isomerase FklB